MVRWDCEPNPSGRGLRTGGEEDLLLPPLLLHLGFVLSRMWIAGEQRLIRLRFYPSHPVLLSAEEWKWTTVHRLFLRLQRNLYSMNPPSVVADHDPTRPKFKWAKQNRSELWRDSAIYFFPYRLVCRRTNQSKVKELFSTTTTTFIPILV